MFIQYNRDKCLLYFHFIENLGNNWLVMNEEWVSALVQRIFIADIIENMCQDTIVA